VRAMRDTLGNNFIGSSNTYLAYKHDLEAIGTNAHELPMALAAMTDDDAQLRASQYHVLDLWQNTYQRELLVMLPDTFGTTQFLASAPDWVADWTGQRMDSKNPYIAGDEYIEWLKGRDRDPEKKLVIASDGLDVEQILGLHAYFSGQMLNGATPDQFRGPADFLDTQKWSPKRRIRFSAGWGTLLTNDFRNCDPTGRNVFDPISLVCKLTEANGRPAVKLSDNYSKAMGEPEELERYRRIFGTAGVKNVPAIV
jgi:nicotinate phosphoribosyltransferase